MALGSRYTRRLRDLSGYWGTWEPTVPIEVGTIGVLDGKVLVPVRHISALPGLDAGLPATVLEKRKVRAAWRSGVSWDSSAGVHASAPAAKASVEFHFTRGLSLLLVIADADYRAFSDIRTAARIILAQYREGNWCSGDILVTHVVEAARVTAMVAEEEGGSVALSANVAPGALPLDWLADAGVRAQVARESGIGFSCYAARATPLFRAVQLNRDWLGRDSVSLVRGDVLDPMDAFAEPDMGEL